MTRLTFAGLILALIVAFLEATYRTVIDQDTRPVNIPGAYIQTLENPARYTHTQLNRVCEIAHQLNRGKFVLCEPPRRS